MSKSTISRRTFLNRVSVSSSYPAMSNLPVYTHDLQMTLFEPVGGMDKLPYALAKKVKDNIQYGFVVNEIRKEENGVRTV